MGELLDEIKYRLRERFDNYIASKAAIHVVERERAQLEKIDAKLERFAARLESTVQTAQSQIESLRLLELDLRQALAELRERPGYLTITGMEELLSLIESLREAGMTAPF